MKLKILTTAHHRNGVAGTPFDVILFKEGGRHGTRKVAVLFNSPGQCAVLDVVKLAAGEIAFGSNSWRGDDYEPTLRQAVGVDASTPPSEPGTSNAERSNRFELTLLSLGGQAAEDLETTLIDLLTDAMHWCNASAEDFHYALAVAGKHYIDELNDEQTEERRMP